MTANTLAKKLEDSARKQARSLMRDWMLWRRLPAIYRESASSPIDRRKILFVDDKSLEMPSAFSRIFPLLEEEYDLDVRFLGLGHNANLGRKAYYGACENLAREAGDAAAIFLADASDVISCLPLRPQTKVVQLWHACGAFKKWGYSTADLKFGGDRRQLDRHPFYKNLDLVTVSSPEVEWAYREAMGLESRPEIVRALGSSRTDLFFDPGHAQAAREDIEAWAPASRGKKIILYAPTFRGHVASAQAPDFLDISRLRKLLGSEYFLLAKHHPFVKRPPAIPEGCEDFAANISGGPAVEKLMPGADFLVTDYSSAVFEWSLLGRPIAFLAPDLDDYIDWRGFYYDYREMTPGPVLSSTDELAAWIASSDESFDPTEIDAFRAKFMSSCDGHATQRIVAEVFGSQELPRKPSVVDRMSRLGRTGPDISIVIPAYNAGLTLERAISSVVAQDYPNERMELIVVDDCSTDSTPAIARAFEREHPGLVKALSTPCQSGTPAAPRNIGIEAARGEYVFFLDADDWLGPEAVRRMLGHALDWDSDVLLVKLLGEGGREVPKSMFALNQPNADLARSKVMWTLAPLKLFRRQLIEDIRFPEGCMPEDIAFALSAYAKAKTVSVASDYAYYHVASEQGEENASVTTWDDIDSNLRAYRGMADIIAGSSKLQGNVPLMRRLFGRDVYRTLCTSLQEPDEAALPHLAELLEIMGGFYDPAKLTSLPHDCLMLLDAVFQDPLVRSQAL